MDFEWSGEAFPQVISSTRSGMRGKSETLFLKTYWQEGTILKLFRACGNKEKRGGHSFYWHCDW